MIRSMSYNRWRSIAMPMLKGMSRNPNEAAMVRPARSQASDGRPGWLSEGTTAKGNRKPTNNTTRTPKPNTTHLVCWRWTGPDTRR